MRVFVSPHLYTFVVASTPAIAAPLAHYIAYWMDLDSKPGRCPVRCALAQSACLVGTYEIRKSLIKSRITNVGYFTNVGYC